MAKDASLHRLLAPDQCLPCILHLNNRIVEKLVQQILLVGMRFYSNGGALDEYVKRVEQVVNTSVMMKSDVQIRQGGHWRFPLTNKKKLDDVSMQTQR